MFDKYVLGRTEYIPYEKTVKINRQSTSDDARLLKDLETEASKKITSEIILSIGKNTINGSIISENNELTNMKMFFAVFSLNEKEYKIKIEVDQKLSKDEMINCLYEEMSKKIIELLINHQSYKPS